MKHPDNIVLWIEECYSGAVCNRDKESFIWNIREQSIRLWELEEHTTRRLTRHHFNMCSVHKLGLCDSLWFDARNMIETRPIGENSRLFISNTK